MGVVACRETACSVNGRLPLPAAALIGVDDEIAEFVLQIAPQRLFHGASAGPLHFDAGRNQGLPQVRTHPAADYGLHAELEEVPRRRDSRAPVPGRGSMLHGGPAPVAGVMYQQAAGVAEVGFQARGGFSPPGGKSDLHG